MGIESSGRYSRKAPFDISKGTVNLTAAPQIVSPFQDLVQLYTAHVLWLVNSSTKPVQVAFQASPDGASPDMDTLTTVQCDPGKSVSLQRAPMELRRYWAIVAYCPTYQAGDTIPVSFGITVNS